MCSSDLRGLHAAQGHVFGMALGEGGIRGRQRGGSNGRGGKNRFHSHGHSPLIACVAIMTRAAALCTRKNVMKCRDAGRQEHSPCRNAAAFRARFAARLTVLCRHAAHALLRHAMTGLSRRDILAASGLALPALLRPGMALSAPAPFQIGRAHV